MICNNYIHTNLHHVYPFSSIRSRCQPFILLYSSIPSSSKKSTATSAGSSPSSSTRLLNHGLRLNQFFLPTIQKFLLVPDVHQVFLDSHSFGQHTAGRSSCRLPMFLNQTCQFVHLSNKQEIHHFLRF